MVKSALKKEPYEIIGYKGKQVRDNLHAMDIARLISLILKKSLSVASWDYSDNVYNLGGGRANSVSILEAVNILKQDFNLTLAVLFNDQERIGDHKWYISDLSKLKTRFDWEPQIKIHDIFEEIIKLS